MKYRVKNDRDKAKRKFKRSNDLGVYKSERSLSFAEIHRMCMDKVRFSSRGTIKKVAKEKGMRYYKCPFCGCFHMTSKKSRESFDPNA